MRFDHINISAPEELLIQEKNFLCDVFEVSEGFRPNFSRPGYWLYHDDCALFHLVESGEHQAGNGYLDHVALSMEGLTEFTNRLVRLGVLFETKEVTQLNRTQIFLTTPAGIAVEVVFQEAKES